MSAISALKGYRTQFLYSLHHILSNLSGNFIYRLEGEEDLDILDNEGQLLDAIQLKNLGKAITLSDILSESKTSFVKRFLENYREATPILVSYGEISKELKNWYEHKDSISEKDKNTLKKYRISIDDWKLVKNKTQFREISEAQIADEVEQLIKQHFPEIDPIPTIGYLLHWLQFIAEKQQPITKSDFYDKVQDFARYLSERISIHEQYGLILKPLHKVSTSGSDQKLLEKEFYNATLTRYEHILLGLDVNRDQYLAKIDEEIKSHHAVILKGASGQGKTALLYAYVHHYVNDWLAYELNIQQDPITTQKSIQAISSISKSLDIPTVFIINVTPNTTEWVKIIRETAHLEHLKFLIAIRNEDWFRATAIGLHFEYRELDLSLHKDEAEIIYSKLNERNKISHFTDFEEAWIQASDEVPLLEFVYAITQGDSLHNKLKQQILQIAREQEQNSTLQLELLRTVSLADAMGAKIDVSRLSSNIEYQFIIEKLENEYLVKISADRKYIQGLHMIRSQKLTEILFDEFISYKEAYAYKTIPLLAEEDLYLFLLQLFYLGILNPDQFLSALNQDFSIDNWSTYASVLKAYIWLGIRQYVETNRSNIDECQAMFAGAWIFFVDFLFSSNYDRNGLLDLFKVDDQRRLEIDDINNRLTPKETVFNLAALLISKVEFPRAIPSTVFQWRSYGEMLFWFKNIPNDKPVLPVFEEAQFEKAFKSMDSKSLSKLMLGMHSYSSALDSIRSKFSGYFIQRIKDEFDVVHVDTENDEVTIHYIIDILKGTELRSSNDFVVNILDIIRTALPDKKKFNSQGYGHRLQTISVDYDPTHKTISIESLPLEEWVNINACITKLYDYDDRPADWNEYSLRVNEWEELIKLKINEFNSSFAKVFAGSKTYQPVVPVMKNASFKFPEKVKEPKTITDPLGVYGGKRKDLTAENKRDQTSKKLQSKYEHYFKSLSDFKASVENFLHQSGKTLQSRIQLKTEVGHIHDENIERLSQTNLYDAIAKLTDYTAQHQYVLGNIDAKPHVKVEQNALLTTAATWKDFLGDNSKGDRSFNRILKLKSDFESKITKELKQFSRSEHFTIRYLNNKTTECKPILIIDGKSPFWSFLGFKEAYHIIHNAIDNPEYTSLKYLMLQVWFSNIYFLQSVQNKTLNNQWNQVPLYNLKDKSFEELSTLNGVPQPVEEQIRARLDIDTWAKLYPEFNKINLASEAYGKTLLLVDHLHDLRLLDEIDLSDPDADRLHEHVGKIVSTLEEAFQTTLDSLYDWTNMFPLEENSYLSSEEEQAYFEAMIAVSKYIFPQPKGNEVNYQVAINMQIIAGWVERLKVCTQSWAAFMLLLSGKYMRKYGKIA